MAAEHGIYHYNPNGIMAQVHKERIIALAGPTAMHMQLALPQVAHSVRQAGFFESQPLARLKQTLDAGANLIFEAPGARDTARRINNIHKHVQGELPETIGAYEAGTKYFATDPANLKWVAATLAYSSIKGYEAFVLTLPDEKKDDYMRESQSFFTLFGLPHNSLPATYDGLIGYIDDMIANEDVKAGNIAQELAPYTMLSHSPLRSRIMNFSKFEFITKSLLPDGIRDDYEYTVTDAEKESFETFALRRRQLLPYIPPVIRYFPQYRAAQKRLAQQQNSGEFFFT